MKKALALTVMLALLILTLTSPALVNVTVADPYMPSGTYNGEPTPPQINFQSPTQKITYWIGSDVWLDFTVAKPVTPWYDTLTNHSASASEGTITEVTYSLDGAPPTGTNKVSEYVGVGSYYSYSINLGRLAAGHHTIVTTAGGSAQHGPITLTQDIHLGSNYTYVPQFEFVSNSASISFDVAAARPTTPPNITLISPKNTTYYYIRDWTSISYVWLTYLADDTRLSVGYSIDGSNVIPAANGTSIVMSIYSHRLTLYANDSFGNSATPQTVTYNIQRYVEEPPHGIPTFNPFGISPERNDSATPSITPTTTPQAYPVLLIIAVTTGAIIITVGVVLLVYVKKFRHKTV